MIPLLTPSYGITGSISKDDCGSVDEFVGAESSGGWSQLRVLPHYETVFLTDDTRGQVYWEATSIDGYAVPPPPPPPGLITNSILFC